MVLKSKYVNNNLPSESLMKTFETNPRDTHHTLKNNNPSWDITIVCPVDGLYECNGEIKRGFKGQNLSWKNLTGPTQVITTPIGQGLWGK